MIVQTAPRNAKPFAITMAEHTELAGKLAREFGNDKFEPVAPRDLMLYVVDHHDQGWSGLDAAPDTDRQTGLPYNLVDTPLKEIAKTSTPSPDFNERHHAFCGLLSSMHIWGLYNGRYGMSDKVLIDAIPRSDRPLLARMLDAELVRQSRLKARLAVDSGETRFAHVPLDAWRVATIKLRPVGNATYALSPYPFARNPVEFQYSGRYIEPTTRSGTLGRHIRAPCTPMADDHVAVGIEVPDRASTPRG